MSTAELEKNLKNADKTIRASALHSLRSVRADVIVELLPTLLTLQSECTEKRTVLGCLENVAMWTPALLMPHRTAVLVYCREVIKCDDEATLPSALECITSLLCENSSNVVDDLDPLMVVLAESLQSKYQNLLQDGKREMLEQIVNAILSIGKSDGKLLAQSHERLFGPITKIVIKEDFDTILYEKSLQVLHLMEQNRKLFADVGVIAESDLKPVEQNVERKEITVEKENDGKEEHVERPTRERRPVDRLHVDFSKYTYVNVQTK